MASTKVVYRSSMDRLVMLFVLQRYCGKEGVRPIKTVQEYEDIMEWGVEDLRGNGAILDQYRGFRHAIMQLAHFYGYLPETFNHEHNPKANIDLDRRADKYQYDYSINKTMKGSVDQSKTAFEPHELADFVERVSNMPDSSESATCLAFIGLTLQSLSRPRQLCEVTRDNIRLYPDTDMHEDADFGPVTMVGVSDKGHLKQDRMAEVTHWVSR